MPSAAAVQRRRAPSNARTRKIRAVLAACKRLGLDDDARKELQLDVTGVASMAAMGEGELGKLLDHLNRDYRGKNPQRPHLAKVKALWWSLYWMGAIDNPDDKALSAFVKRQCGIAALRFLDHRSAPSVIEALKDWLRREGVVWPKVDPLGTEDRWAVIAALRGRAIEKVGLDNLPTLPSSTANDRMLDEHLIAVGKLYRRAIGK